MEFRSNNYPSIPPVVKNLLIINVVVYVLQYALNNQFGVTINNWFALHHWSSSMFQIWQLVTHMFMHSTYSIMHIFSNMFALWMFGSILENRFGAKRFLNFYLLCGLGAAILHLITMTFTSSEAELAFSETVGASGAVFGLLFAFGYLFPNTELYMYFIPIPIKAKYFVAMYALFELYAGLQSFAGDNVAHFAHLGGMLVAFIILKIWNKTDRGNFY